MIRRRDATPEPPRPLKLPPASLVAAWLQADKERGTKTIHPAFIQQNPPSPRPPSNRPIPGPSSEVAPVGPLEVDNEPSAPWHEQVPVWDIDAGMKRKTALAIQRQLENELWPAFFARRAKRNAEKWGKFTDEERRACDQRTEDARKGVLIHTAELFQWMTVMDFEVRRRTNLSRAEAEVLFKSSKLCNRRYDKVRNEWDVCSEFEDDELEEGELREEEEEEEEAVHPEEPPKILDYDVATPRFNDWMKFVLENFDEGGTLLSQIASQLLQRR